MKPKSGKATRQRETRRQVLPIQAAQSICQTGQGSKPRNLGSRYHWAHPSARMFLLFVMKHEALPVSTPGLRIYQQVVSCVHLLPSCGHTQSSVGPRSPPRFLFILHFYRKPQQYADSLVEKVAKLSPGPRPRTVGTVCRDQKGVHNSSPSCSKERTSGGLVLPFQSGYSDLVILTRIKPNY